MRVAMGAEYRSAHIRREAQASKSSGDRRGGVTRRRGRGVINEANGREKRWRQWRREGGE
jgi:hypothetical protein